MSMIENLSCGTLSRRTFLKGAVAGTGGLVLGLTLAPIKDIVGNAHAAATALTPNLFVSIDKSGTVTIIAHRSEMGQGSRTGLPMIVADELEADWGRVVLEQAEGDKKYGSQNTDGSRSVVKNFQRMREFGATARHMLEQAAATQWGVASNTCKAQNHGVVHVPSGRTLGYGALVETASGLPVPDVKHVRLKDPKDFRYIGKSMPIVDLEDMTRGRAIYGIDVTLPDMKYASVERCPVVLGKVKSYDASETLKVPGVERVVELPAVTKPVFFKALGGLAVVASNTWAAQEGRRRLKVEWDFGENASYDSVAYRKAMEETARQPGQVRRETGDVSKAFEAAAKVIEGEYYVPHFVHVPMEPPAAVARVKNGKCEVWSSTQNPQAARTTVAAALGIDEANVISRVTLLGGGFGRKSKPDFAAEAALISKQIGAPVKVTWSREDDVRHGYYHAVSTQYAKGGLDKNGKTIAWLQRSVFPSIMSTFKADVNQPAGWEVTFGLVDLPYDIPNICLETGKAAAHVRIGWLRSVQNIFHAFAINSFVNELAVAAGRDPLEYALELLGDSRHIDLAAQGIKEKYDNYGHSLTDYPIDTLRLRNVLQLAAKKAEWGDSLPEREGLGFAVHRSFVTYIATVVHVAVSKDGKLSIPRVDMAVDAGRVVNPDRVRSQMEGATIYGMSAACYSEITAKAGRVQQGNFDTYPVVRIVDAPRETHVHIVASDAPPGGIGEPGTPPFAPALCNAIYAATGKRIRSLPISKHDLSA